MKTSVIVYFALVVLLLSSCQKSSGDGATVPGVNGQCITNATSCNSAAYNQANRYGFTAYGNSYNNGYGYSNGAYNYNYNNPYNTYYYNYNNPYSYGNYNYGTYNPFYNYNNTSYLCNCPAGTVPTYNGYAGLGCVSRSNFSFGLSAYFYLGWGAGASTWNNISTLNRYGSSCYSGAVQSCAVNQPNTCPLGSSCQASSGSGLGLCVSTR